jgi:hypothetical protein
MASNKHGSCFVIMGIGHIPRLDDVYELGIRAVAEKLGYECVRSDKVEHNLKITDRVVYTIANSTFIIADLTGERPNCYYEVGYAHALRKDVILLVEKNTPIHFDLKDYNFIIYERIEDLKEKLEERILGTIRQPTADNLTLIRDAIKEYLKFAESVKKEMFRCRITVFDVQSYEEKEKLPTPFSYLYSLNFHVKEGLRHWEDTVVFDEEEGSVNYIPHRRKSTKEFVGLIQKASDLKILQDKIGKRFDAVTEA